CGASAIQWFGTCPSCGAAGTLTETAAEKPSAHRYSGGAQAVSPAPRAAIRARESEPVATGVAELDRALGGGLVAGQVVLIGGDPGIGKSTLLLPALAGPSAARSGFYVTGEESAEQVALRSRRLALEAGNIQLLAEIRLERIAAALEAHKPQ